MRLEQDQVHRGSIAGNGDWGLGIGERAMSR